jgi:CO/xanthine dehydrogenase Mo-binding subunit
LDTLKAIRRFRSSNDGEEKSQPTNIRRGKGIACMHYGIGYTAVRNPSPVDLELSKEGIVTIYSGAVDMGQGPATIFRQMVVEDLGVPFERTRVSLADTDLSQNSLTTCASRTTYYSGNAIRMAASRLNKIILDTLSCLSNQECTSFVLDRDHLRSGDFDITLSRFHKYCTDNGISLRTEGLCDPDVTGLTENGEGSPYATYAYATQMADVEVNLETGNVKVLRVVSAHDVGKAINPLLIEEQIEGAVLQGLGYALMEDYRQEDTVDFKNYKIPRFPDTPEIVSMLLETEDPSGPFGAKGVAECALIPTAVSITNAIANAIGAKITQIPVKPDHIIDIVKSREKGR